MPQFEGIGAWWCPDRLAAMTLDWLFGPRMTVDPRFAVPERTSFIFRPVVLDVEDVVDLAGYARSVLIASGVSDASISYVLPHEAVNAQQLLALNPVDRERIEIHVIANRGEATVYASYAIIISLDRRGSNVVVNAQSQHGVVNIAEQERIAGAVITWILKAGSARVRWSLLAWTLPFLPMIAMILAYIWAAIARLSAPAHVFALATIAATASAAVWAARVIYRRATQSVPGTRIRVESRAETYRRRADHRRDWRVAILSILGTLLVVAVGWLVTGQWGR